MSKPSVEPAGIAEVCGTDGRPAASDGADISPVVARTLLIRGRVQGVGFRPFVHRLATRFALAGSVRNLSGEVAIHIEGSRQAIASFESALIAEAPPLARATIARSAPAAVTGVGAFTIESSASAARADVHLPPDQALCPDCLAELDDAQDRRHGYAFTNCTACGPRYTIIEGLPYDRAATSMAAFAMCAACRREYEDPTDRRFHAEPTACPDCGPRLRFAHAASGTAGQAQSDSADPLAAALTALRAGAIVAVRGIGGYHLMCDAANDGAVERLRARKRRPAKPLAVMFPHAGGSGLDAVRRSVDVDQASAARLADPARPIVLLPRRADCPLSRLLAPGLGELGVMLPYSPLHHLLLAAFAAPLVATSGNISGEPVLTAVADADARLAGIADAFLHHDRDIVRPADDAVERPFAGALRPIRLGRGTAPLEVALPVSLERPLLALGGQAKVTLALGIGDRAVISPHLGDLDTPRGFDQFVRLADDLPRLHGAQPAALVCDRHPGFAGTQWARRQRRPIIAVQHHHAHASALACEHPDVTRWLIFTWDGVGYGEDATLWGGEAFHGAPGAWRRVASFRPFRPPGGDLAARAPWRSAAALLWESGRTAELPLSGEAGRLLHAAWLRGLNAPATSAVGRLFDAAAFFVAGIAETSFEGEGAMQLEHLAANAPALAQHEVPRLPLARDGTGLLRTDWTPLLAELREAERPAATRARAFHESLAGALAAQAVEIDRGAPFDAIGLTGGVFQNRVLAEIAVDRLAALGYRVELPRLAPANDGGLSLGQVVEAAALLARADPAACDV